MKYEFTDERRLIQDGMRTLRRIRRLSDGQLGGWIEGEHNLTQEGACWVADEAQVYGEARVYGRAQVYGQAQVYGEAQVSGSARVFGQAQVHDRAQVYGQARVFGGAWVSGEARVYDRAWVCDRAWVYGRAQVYGEAQVFGEARVYGQTQIYGKTELSDETGEVSQIPLARAPIIPSPIKMEPSETAAITYGRLHVVATATEAHVWREHLTGKDVVPRDLWEEELPAHIVAFLVKSFPTPKPLIKGEAWALIWPDGTYLLSEQEPDENPNRDPAVRIAKLKFEEVSSEIQLLTITLDQFDVESKRCATVVIEGECLTAPAKFEILLDNTVIAEVLTSPAEPTIRYCTNVIITKPGRLRLRATTSQKGIHQVFGKFIKLVEEVEE